MGFLLDLLCRYFAKPPPIRIEKELVVRVQKALTVRYKRRIIVQVLAGKVLVDGIVMYEGNVSECKGYLLGLEQGLK